MCPSAWVDNQEDILFSWLHLYIMPILLLWDLRTLCVVYQNSDPKIHFLANSGQKSTSWLFSFETLLLNIELVLVLYFKIALLLLQHFTGGSKSKKPLYFYFMGYKNENKQRMAFGPNSPKSRFWSLNYRRYQYLQDTMYSNF